MLMPVLETSHSVPALQEGEGSQANTAGRKGFGKLKVFP